MPRRNVNYEAAPASVADTVAQLGRNIATARVRRRLREDDLAAKAGITRTTLRRVEAGAFGTGIGPPRKDSPSLDGPRLFGYTLIKCT